MYQASCFCLLVGRRKNKSLEKLRNDLLDELAALEQENYDKTQTEQELEEQKAREKYFRLKTLAENEIEDDNDSGRDSEGIEIDGESGNVTFNERESEYKLGVDSNPRTRRGCEHRLPKRGRRSTD